MTMHATNSILIGNKSIKPREKDTPVSQFGFRISKISPFSLRGRENLNTSYHAKQKREEDLGLRDQIEILYFSE